MATDPDALEGQPPYSEDLEKKASREAEPRDVKGEWVETAEDNPAAEAIEEEYGPVKPMESMGEAVKVEPFADEPASPKLAAAYPAVAKKPYRRKPDW